MSCYIETPINPALPARAFRIHNGAWETTAAADAGNPRARWYGFSAMPPRDVLAQAYVDLIGYDPFEDCPDICPADVSRTLMEYAGETPAVDNHYNTYETVAENLALSIWESATGNGRDDPEGDYIQACHDAVANAYLPSIGLSAWHARAESRLGIRDHDAR